MEKKLNIRQFYIVLFIFSFSSISYSNIWVEPEDEHFIKHLELAFMDLNSAVDTTTYPISSELLKNVNQNSFTDFANLTSYISKIDEFFPDKPSQKITLRSSSDLIGIRDINDEWKDKNSISISTRFKPKTFAGELKFTKVDSSLSNKKYYLDGTHLSFTTLNTIFGVGVFNRWWGPTHDNNLILSNYARPSPGIFLSSLKGLEFTNFLNIFGKINYAFFINRLESNRAIPKANLLGGRLTLMPLDNLTIGVSRTLMFGGGNRPNDLETLWKAVIGQDNVYAGEVDPSNQLAGWDLKYDFFLKDKMFTTYVQNIGEDGDFGRYFISKEIVVLGLELKYLKEGLLKSYGLEFSNTIGDYGLLYNVNYEHFNYKTGYRYRNLPIGAFTDNDSLFLNFKFISEINSKFRYSSNLFYGKLNRDGSGQNVWGNQKSKVLGFKSKINYLISDSLSLETNVILKDSELFLLDNKLDKNSINLALHYSF